jgi:tetratricopeptide (TPR) repeat protein
MAAEDYSRTLHEARVGKASQKKDKTPSRAADAASRPGSSWLLPAGAFLAGIGIAAALFLSKAPPGKAGAPPRSAEAKAALAKAREHLSGGQPALAQAELERALTRAPDDADLQFTMGDAAYQTMQMKVAEAHYRRASELDPSSAAAFANLALVRLELGQAGEATEAARRALALKPDDARFAALLGQSLLRGGQAGEAAELLESALARGVGGAEKRAALGRARDQLGQTDAALAAFDAARRDDPYHPLVHYWRAECLRRAGRKAEAAAALAEYRKLQLRSEELLAAEARAKDHPDDVKALLDVARQRVERGRPSQAIPAVMRAEQLAPADPEVKKMHALVERAVAAGGDVQS